MEISEHYEPADKNIVGTYYVKTHLSELLDRVEKGEVFIVTRNGKPIARFLPSLDEELEEKKRLAREGYEKSMEARKGVTLGPNLTIKDLINEGRKYL